MYDELNEFLDAVRAEDSLMIDVCFSHTDPRVFALRLARVLNDNRDVVRRAIESEKQVRKLEQAYVEARLKVVELRKLLDASASTKRAS